MVAQLTALQVKLTWRSLRGNTGKKVATAVVGVYGIFLMLVVWTGGFALRDHGPELAWIIGTPVMALVGTIWFVTLLLLGTTDPLEPARFALLPVSAKQLRPGLLAAGLLTLGGLFTTGIAIGFLIAWAGSWQLALVASLAIVLGQGLVILALRTVSVAMTALFASRRFRDLAGLGLGVILLGTVIWVQIIASRETSLALFAGPEQLAPIAQIAGWTPFGWAWALPGDVARGAWLLFVIRLVMCLLALGALWLVWGRLLDRTLTSPIASGGSAGHTSSLEFVDRLMPNTPAGAVGARAMRYWFRDPRRQLQALSMLAMPIVFTVIMLTWDVPREWLMLAPGLGMSLTVMTLAASDLSYDGAALHVEVLAGTRGIDDRWGRVLALGSMVSVVNVLLCLGAAAYVGNYAFLPAALLAVLGVEFVAIGVGSVAGAVWTYPVPPTNQVTSSRGNLTSAIGAVLAMLTQAVLTAPIVVLAAFAISNPTAAWLSPLVSIGLGGLVLWAGLRLGAAYLDSHWPEILKNITWSKA